MSKLYFLLGAFTLSIASAQSLVVINPNFANVPVECNDGFAYQSINGGTCSSPFFQQAFNVTPGIGWKFAPVPQGNGGDGLTYPNSGFDPPPFTGLPFSTAVFLQGPNSKVLQTIHGFVPGVAYELSFYLGSRYANYGYDGNQTVQITIDGKSIATIALVSFTPFTFHAVYFGVASGGSHVLKFAGIVAGDGDHTAFFSGVHILAITDSAEPVR